MVRDAVPPERVTGDAKEVPFKKKFTVPVAVAGVTVAVKVISELSHEGLLPEVTVIVVAVCATAPKQENTSSRVVTKEVIL